MSILALLQLAVSLLVSVQSPDVPLAARQQALALAKQTVEIASLQIQTMEQSSTSQPVEPQPAPQSFTPSPASAPTPQATNQDSAGPTLGAAEPQPPESPFSIQGNSVSKSGGVFNFTVTKDGKPVDTIDKISGNVTHQVFIRLPEDLPPGRGQFHIYIPEQTEDVTSPSLDMEIEGTVINVPITITP